MTTHKIAQGCSMAGCSRPIHARKLCGCHYRQAYKAGRLDEFSGRSMFVKNPIDFWKYVEVTADDSRCWNWTRGGHRFGYGQVTINGKRWDTHRYAFFLNHGYDSTLNVLHECDNPRCCNPKHLTEGTQEQNIRDAWLRNRMPRGERHYSSTVSDADALAIKQRLLNGNTSIIGLAKEFKVPMCTVSNINRGKTFKHLVLE